MASRLHSLLHSGCSEQLGRSISASSGFEIFRELSTPESLEINREMLKELCFVADPGVVSGFPSSGFSAYSGWVLSVFASSYNLVSMCLITH